MSNFQLWKVLSNRFLRRRNKCVEIRIKSREALQKLHYNITNKKKQRVLRLCKPIFYNWGTIASNETTLIDGEYVATNEHYTARKSDKCHTNNAKNSGGKKTVNNKSIDCFECLRENISRYYLLIYFSLAYNM